MIRILMTPEALGQFEGLPRTIKERIRKLVERLAEWPAVSGIKPLRGSLAGWYRIRTGDYRLRFRIDRETIVIDKIGHRKDVYDE